MNAYKWTVMSLAGVAMVLVSGCEGYVKRQDFNTKISQLQSEQATLESKVQDNTSAIADLKSQLEARLKKYDVRISQLEGRISVDHLAHFAFDKATLRMQDKPALDQFSSVMNKYHPNAVVTVEGFADAAGSVAFNKHLGMRRAEAVREYLVTHDGMQASRVRAVSYGKARNRQVIPGGWGKDGLPNRRVTLVVDQAG